MSFSYAYYVASTNENTSFNTTTISSSEVPSIVFSQSQNINTTIGVPILSADVATKAPKNIFTVTVGNNLSSAEVSIKISLTNIIIDNILKDSSFKWQLLQNDTQIASGNFTSITGNTLTLKNFSKLNVSSYPTTFTYELRIWLEEICSSATDLTTCSDYSAWQSAYNSGTETYPYNSPNSTVYGQSRLMNKKLSAVIEVASAVKTK